MYRELLPQPTPKVTDAEAIVEVAAWLVCVKELFACLKDSSVAQNIDDMYAGINALRETIQTEHFRKAREAEFLQKSLEAQFIQEFHLDQLDRKRNLTEV